MKAFKARVPDLIAQLTRPPSGFQSPMEKTETDDAAMGEAGSGEERGEAEEKTGSIAATESPHDDVLVE